MARLDRLAPLHAIDEQAHRLVHHLDDRVLGAGEIGPQAPDPWDVVGLGD